MTSIDELPGQQAIPGTGISSIPGGSADRLAIHYSNQRDDWCTPPKVLDPVKAFAVGGRIGLDPCWNAHSMTDPVTAFSENDDGLSKSWALHGLVFVNPPYSQLKTKRGKLWMTKLRDEVDEGIALIPARTETKAFPDHADVICFIDHRLKFYVAGSEAQHAAPFPSALAFWGNTGERARVEEFIERFSHLGWMARVVR